MGMPKIGAWAWGVPPAAAVVSACAAMLLQGDSRQGQPGRAQATAAAPAVTAPLSAQLATGAPADAAGASARENGSKGAADEKRVQDLIALLRGCVVRQNEAAAKTYLAKLRKMGPAAAPSIRSARDATQDPVLRRLLEKALAAEGD